MVRQCEALGSARRNNVLNMLYHTSRIKIVLVSETYTIPYVGGVDFQFKLYPPDLRHFLGIHRTVRLIRPSFPRIALHVQRSSTPTAAPPWTINIIDCTC